MILFSTENFSFWKQIVSASSFMQFIIISLKVVSIARWFFENAEVCLHKFVQSQSMHFCPVLLTLWSTWLPQLQWDSSLGADDYLFGHLLISLKVSNWFCGCLLILTLIYKCYHALFTCLVIVIEQFIKWNSNKICTFH